MKSSKHKVIEEACFALDENRILDAKKIIQSDYPFTPLKSGGRQYSEFQKTKIFLRDGFIDRYSGEKMIFPPVLRLISNLIPEEFPFHKNWKMSECHIAYWQLLPTIDHIIPVARGGLDEESNWVCTSQIKNSAKSNWLLEELGWRLYEPGRTNEWNGLLYWFIDYIKNNPEALKDSYINSWHKAAFKQINQNQSVGQMTGTSRQ